MRNGVQYEAGYFSFQNINKMMHLENQQNFWTVYRKVAYFSLVMCLALSFSNSALAFFPYLAQQRGLPALSPLLAALFFTTSLVGMLILPRWLKNWPFNRLMALGTFSTTLYISNLILVSLVKSDNFLVLCVAMALITAFAGLITSLMYYSQCVYVSQNALSISSGIIFGFSWMIIQSSNLLGNLINQLLSFYFNTIQVFMISTSLSLLTVAASLCISNVERPSDQTDYSALTKSFYNKKFVRIFPLFIFTGLVISFIFGYLTLIAQAFLQSDDQKQRNRAIFLVLVCEGLGEIFGGLLVFKSVLKIRNLAFAFSLLFLFALMAILVSLYFKEYSLFCVASFMCGVCDCGLQSVSLSLTDEVKQNEQSQLVVYNVIMIGSVVAGLMSNLLAGKNVIWIIGLISLGATLSGLSVSFT